MSDSGFHATKVRKENESERKPASVPPEEDQPLVPFGCFPFLFVVVFAFLDFIVSLMGFSFERPDAFSGRVADWLSSILLFPFSVFSSASYYPALHHLLSCVFWTAVLSLLVWFARRRRRRKESNVEHKSETEPTKPVGINDK